MSENNFAVDLWYAADIKGRVENGAKWLDSVKPGWHHLIDLSELDMKSGETCICGQVFMEDVMQFNLLNDDEIDHGYTYIVDHVFQEETDCDEFTSGIKASNFGFNYSPVDEIMFDNYRTMSKYEYNFDIWYATEMSLLAEEWVLQIEKRVTSIYPTDKE